MTIDYTTKYSSKRKTLGLSVERDKSIVVFAPEGTSPEIVQNFVEKKRFWLFKQLNYSPKFTERLPDTPFVSGKSIMYLGRNYKLDVVEESFDGIRFNSKFFISKNNLPFGLELLKSWYKTKAEEKIIPTVKRFAQELGVTYNSISISDLKYTWGSCSPKNNLNFNWKLIKAPMFVINYVAVHELAHLIELNHTEDFWNIVKVQMPNFEEGKIWLKENGDRLLN